jgi:hypothetical protein
MLEETQRSPDNEPKVPEQVWHKGKGEVYPRTRHEHPDDEQTYRFSIYLNSSVDGVVSSTPFTRSSTAGKKVLSQVYRKLRGLQRRSGRVQTISLLTGVQSPDRPNGDQTLHRPRLLNVGHSASYCIKHSVLFYG